MATRILDVSLRIALLVALVASVVLFVDYGSSASPAVCGAGGGCAKVRDSAFSHVGPVSLPTLGLTGFAALFAISLVATERRHRVLLAGLTGVAAVAALGLIGLQIFVVGAICPWCMAVDVGALVAAGLAWVLARRTPATDGGGANVETVPLRLLWALAGVVVVAVPMLWNYGASAQEVSLPKPLLKYQAEGKVNVIMFTDFQCPHCERLHDAMEAARGGLGDRLHLVRLMNPLSFHPGAKPAALAYLCVSDEQREAAADRLYKADDAELTPKGVLKIAEELGADPKALSACMGDPRTLRQIEHEQELFRMAELEGVPSTFVNAELIRGADVVRLRSALDRAQGGDGGGSDVTWMFVFIALVVGAVAASSLRAARSGDAA